MIGTEPLKYFSSKTSITECSGSLVPSNVKRFGEHKGMLAITNPFAMIFRPEAKEPFDLALSRITDIINGVSRGKAECFYNSSMISDSLIFEECDEAERTGVLSMDSETTSFHIHKGHIIGLCLSHQPFQGTYTHADVISDAALHRIQQVLDNPKVDIVGHNMKFDLKFFKHHFGLNFDKAFKENAVKLSLEHKNVSGLAQELGIAPFLLYLWWKEFRQKGESGFPGNGVWSLSEDAKRIVEPEKRPGEAETERDILKKTFFTLDLLKLNGLE